MEITSKWRKTPSEGLYCIRDLSIQIFSWLSATKLVSVETYHGKEWLGSRLGNDLSTLDMNLMHKILSVSLSWYALWDVEHRGPYMVALHNLFFVTIDYLWNVLVLRHCNRIFQILDRHFGYLIGIFDWFWAQLNRVPIFFRFCFTLCSDNLELLEDKCHDLQIHTNEQEKYHDV